MPKNFDPAHLDSVALGLAEDLEFGLSVTKPSESQDWVAELDEVLTWCLRGSPVIQHVTTRLGVVQGANRFADLQAVLRLNPLAAQRLGELIATHKVNQNWGEDLWLNRTRTAEFYSAEFAEALRVSPFFPDITASIIRNTELLNPLIAPNFPENPTSAALQSLLKEIPSARAWVVFEGRPGTDFARASDLVLHGYQAWALAMISASLAIYDALDDIEFQPDPHGSTIGLESVTNLDAQATTGVNQTSESFIGLFSELLQSGKLGEFDQAAGEHNLRQFLGEMQNPEGATGHVVRGYEMKMVEIYHRHIGVQGLRLVADDATVEKVESAITQAIEMGNAVEPEEAAKLAEPIPTALAPSLSSREKFTSALGWTSGAALSATFAGAGGAKLIDGLGELGKILPAPWGAMIGAILGLLAYTFKPKGKS
jgi:hypothetical protein